MGLEQFRVIQRRRSTGVKSRVRVLCGIGFSFTPLLFGAEHGAGSEASLSSGGLAQEGGASIAHDYGLGVAVAGFDRRASWVSISPQGSGKRARQGREERT